MQKFIIKIMGVFLTGFFIWMFFVTPQLDLKPVSVAKDVLTKEGTLIPVQVSEITPTAEPQNSADLYQTTSNSVVSITGLATYYNTINPLFEILPVPYQQDAILEPTPTPYYEDVFGTGFVWDQKGHVITNKHVIDKVEDLVINFADGTSFPAKVIGGDNNSDLAVLQIIFPSKELAQPELHPVTLADSDLVRVGEKVIAIGNPFGLNGTMTEGIISALHRSLDVYSENNSASTYVISDVIQTDAALNPGNSGGVLLNFEGQVIGITSSIRSPIRGNVGIGFAIPANTINRIVPVLIDKGQFDYPFLGISGVTLTPQIALATHLDKNQKGVLVVEVTADSPAAKAGIKAGNENFVFSFDEYLVGGDVIQQINDQKIEKFEEIVNYITRKATVGEEIVLTILREGQTLTLPVALVTRSSSFVAPTVTPKADFALGIQGSDLTPKLAEAMNLPPNQQGVLVVTVKKDSLAEKAGLLGSQGDVCLTEKQCYPLGGDVIIAWQERALTSMEQLTKVLPLYHQDEVAALLVLRNGQEKEIIIRFTSQ